MRAVDIYHSQQEKRNAFPVLNHSKVASDIYSLAPARSKTVMVGDSLTFNFPWYEACGYANRGISGETSKDVLNRIESIKAMNPDKVYLLIGTNDVLQGIDPYQTASNINRIVESLKPATTYVVSLPPLYKKDVLPYNTLIKPDVSPAWTGETEEGIHLTKPSYEAWKKAVGC